eukprot:TRINITY_DN3238_c0_g1_i1.p1 TRINITY_DN3238_c0_g1~~TRINITY_DN3238_c0_g1_i1.p1  ORF type:complete len:656 (+),score=230.62 TRINITY_DN3238_c0_g1_i1:208-2175(+)
MGLYAKGVAALLLALQLQQGVSHPLCEDDSSPVMALKAELKFCTHVKRAGNDKGSCCNAQQEAAVKATYYDIYPNMSEECAKLQEQVACSTCEPYAVHLHPDGSELPIMCKGFCKSYFDACKVDLGLPANFCEVHVSDSYYCYPVDDSIAGASTELTPYFNNLWKQMPQLPVGMFIRPDANKWWILDQNGVILEIDNDPAADKVRTVIDINEEVMMYGEMGLLGLAFSPDFKTSKRFYIYFIDNDMKATIAYLKWTPGDAKATADSMVRIFSLLKPYPNHNGGSLQFAPGDYLKPTGQAYYDLYVSVGDGGDANNPSNSAQKPGELFGKILRLRMSTDPAVKEYTIPDDNPRIKGKDPNEVFAYGFRNPWRCSFDKAKIEKPRLWCGDVGQDKVEKVTKVMKGENHGWRNFEGTRYNDLGSPDITFVQPEYEYCHAPDSDALCTLKPYTGQSVTGGYVYRGKSQADQYGGQYIFADYQQGLILRIFKNADGTNDSDVIATTGFYISALAQDGDGELYIVKWGDGMVYKLPDKPAGSVDAPVEYPGQSKTPQPTPVPEPQTPDTPAPTVAETTPEPTAAASAGAKPVCRDGVQADTFCCKASCKKCGGTGCELRPGGEDACCTSKITKTCSATVGAPCVLPGGGFFETILGALTGP